jgi:Zn-dependent protease
MHALPIAAVGAIDFSPQNLSLLAAWYFVFIVSIVLHEGGHALAAWKLGDPTAYYAGQASVNPLPHIQREPIGTVVVPIVSYLLGGWMMGWASAPYDPNWAIRYPRRAVLMAMAGPLANLLLLAAAFAAMRLGLETEFFRRSTPDEWVGHPFEQIVMAKNAGIAFSVAKMLSILFSLNLLLFLFNLLPLPPLDGSAVLQLLMKQETAIRFQHFMRQPAFLIIGLIVASNLLGKIFWPVFVELRWWLYAGS